MNNERNIAYATALLRISLGTMFLAHGLLLKVFMYSLAGTAGFFESIGYPGFLAYVVAFAETIAGILLILGIGSRWVAVAMIPVLIGALMVHLGNGWVFSAPNGGWEYPLYLVIVSVAQFLLGDGAFALGPKLQRDRPRHAFA